MKLPDIVNLLASGKIDAGQWSQTIQCQKSNQEGLSLISATAVASIQVK
jgi:hypothetical protein